MTILDDRAGIARLGPTPLSLLRDAVDRAEGDIDDLTWEVYGACDADSFKGLDIENLPLPFKGKSREEIAEHLDDTRRAIQSEVDSVADALREKVVGILEKLADDFESELVRLTT